MDSPAGILQINACSLKTKMEDGSVDSGGKPAGGSLKMNARLKYVLKTKMLKGDQEIEELFSQAEAQGN